MTKEDKLKVEIAKMGHQEMCRAWRFAQSGDPRFVGEVGDYFKSRLFDYFGGFTPGISKGLGWDR